MENKKPNFDKKKLEKLKAQKSKAINENKIVKK